MRLLAAIAAFSLATVLAAPHAVQALEPVFTAKGLAIRGYDPVAYFTERKPVPGEAEHALQWNGATWRFATAANRATFQEAPERYAPQFGGYCAWAVSQGYTASVDPDAWSVVENKLYLNYSRSIRERWSGDVPGNIRKGEENWPKLLGGK